MPETCLKELIRTIMVAAGERFRVVTRARFLCWWSSTNDPVYLNVIDVRSDPDSHAWPETGHVPIGGIGGIGGTAGGSYGGAGAGQSH